MEHMVYKQVSKKATHLVCSHCTELLEDLLHWHLPHLQLAAVVVPEHERCEVALAEARARSEVLMSFKSEKVTYLLTYLLACLLAYLLTYLLTYLLATYLTTYY